MFLCYVSVQNDARSASKQVNMEHKLFTVLHHGEECGCKHGGRCEKGRCICSVGYHGELCENGNAIFY